MTVPTNVAALHEAAHAAALLAFDWPPTAVRLDYPQQRTNGGVTPDWTARDVNDRRSMEQLLVSVLAGPGIEGVNLDLLDWPIDASTWPEGSERDGEMAAFIADRLDLDRIGWLQIAFQATTLVHEPSFRFEVIAIADALDHAELLLQPELSAIHQRMN